MEAAAAWLVGDEPDRGHAAEYVDVVRALWDSWDDDAFVRDVDEGRYYDPAGLHTPEYSGSHYRVRGPLNISRPPQGHVVVIQDVSTVSAEPDLDVDVLVVDTPGHRIEPTSRSAGGVGANPAGRCPRARRLAARRRR